MVALAPVALAPMARTFERTRDTDHDDDIEVVDVDRELFAAVSLAGRAQRMRRQADAVHPLVASAYRRRAAELRLAAWVGAVRAGVDEPGAVLEFPFDDGDETLDELPLDAA
jgi:hypothetical protein